MLGASRAAALADRSSFFGTAPGSNRTFRGCQVNVPVS